jgi:rhodanese-related sulfurtransferase
MNATTASIPPIELYRQIGGAAAPVVIDIRPAPSHDERLIVSALRRAPGDVAQWSRELASGRRVVIYGDRDDVSKDVVAALRASGADMVALEGGFAAWTAAGLPTRRAIGATSKWVTRERPKIDRIACPWLIRRFIDPGAEFIYVPTPKVLEVARQVGGTPYDIEGVEFAHEGERCSFDTILRIFDIHDPAVDQLAVIVRGADTSRHDLAGQCGGLFAISLGLSANFADDHEMLGHGMVMYDALYTWCRSLQHETHNWPTVKQRAAAS